MPKKIGKRIFLEIILLRRHRYRGKIFCTPDSIAACAARAEEISIRRYVERHALKEQKEIAFLPARPVGAFKSAECIEEVRGRWKYPFRYDCRFLLPHCFTQT